jgi:hypothetical protein
MVKYISEEEALYLLGSSVKPELKMEQFMDNLIDIPLLKTF